MTPAEIAARRASASIQLKLAQHPRLVREVEALEAERAKLLDVARAAMGLVTAHRDLMATCGHPTSVEELERAEADTERTLRDAGLWPTVLEEAGREGGSGE